MSNVLNLDGVTPKLSRNEGLKQADPTLAGTIVATLEDGAADHFSDDDYEFLKFHGIYQQDDRDLRKTGKKFIFMVRSRLPGGVVSPEQYLAFDDLSSRYANHTLRITSRQGFQFHGVVKGGLRALIRGINDALATTLAACGDVNRNVMAPPTPATSPLVETVLADAKRVSDALLPRATSHHEIWLEGVQLKLDPPSAKEATDPLYGRTYLPRKFKIAFAIPPLNDVDLFTNCLGFAAITEGNRLLGYNLTAGGGMGRSHNNEATFPRVADVIGFIPADRLVEAAKGVLTIHRDFGDRTNRKHARLKYVLAERGADWFRAELDKRLGFKLEPARPFQFTRQGDSFGWHRQTDGRWFLGLFVETGRIRDTAERQLKTALRKVVEQSRPEVRLTPSNSLLLVNLPGESREAINALLAEHGVPVEKQASPIRAASMACVALPTCGLALAESERFLPGLVTRLEQLLSELGLADQEITVRMTGCPNGCARPYMAEIGVVGRAPGKYLVYLGGNEPSTRLNRPFRDNVKDSEIVETLRPVLARYAAERTAGERFGDWVARVLWAEQPAA
jgi:sulfite reductase (NADPH) hemoprotein beta-component